MSHMLIHLDVVTRYNKQLLLYISGNWEQQLIFSNGEIQMKKTNFIAFQDDTVRYDTSKSNAIMLFTS